MDRTRWGKKLIETPWPLPGCSVQEEEHVIILTFDHLKYIF